MKKEIVEEIEKDIKERNTMTKEYEGKVNKRIFSNILIAILMSAYLMILLLGNKNIERNIFLLDLKIISIVIALISIIIFEKSYRKLDGKLCMYGVEFLILAFINLTSVYILQMAENIFITVICSLVVAIAVYYIIKSIVIYTMSKKKFIESKNDINDIIKEELPETVETKRRRNTLEAEMAEYAKLNAEEDSKKVTRTITTNIRKKEESLFDDEDDDVDINDIEFGNTKINNKITNFDIEDFEDDELGINNFKIEDSKEKDLEEIKLVEKIIEPEEKATTKKKSTTVKSSLSNKSETKKGSTVKSNTKKYIDEEPKEKLTKKRETKKEDVKKANTKGNVEKEKSALIKETKATVSKKETVGKLKAKRNSDKT